ncbi:hypothetical protein [Staphylococcus sp. 17KM0847]|uniref:hypothetical protein n=1 Tax=Staphylococcus sp. 17KM0847 TaxID=2583989 RepID=UPI0015DCA904|nr:hypothetical protein [Staphylococcus sp. 17KM0847]QLK86888.1 hypothetical protein FGL66_09360 [Staphylococcus sp. 17KM0847]
MSLTSQSSAKYIIGYHATKKDNVEEILRTQCFKYNRFNRKVVSLRGNAKTKMPNDLGNGAYFFIEDQRFVVSAQEVAKAYYKKVKQASTKYDGAIIKAMLDKSERFLGINFNEARNIMLFNAYKKENLSKINKIFNDAMISNKTYQRAKREGRIDGLAIEMLILSLESENQNIDYVMLDTQIEVDHLITRIPNAQEICIRNQKMITKLEEVK